jgi:hypothetical protein
MAAATAGAAGAGAPGNPVILIQSPFDYPVLPPLASRVATVAKIPQASNITPPNWLPLVVLVVALGYIYLNQQKGRK